MHVLYRLHPALPGSVTGPQSSLQNATFLTAYGVIR